jgi:hypothetical protein
MGGHSVTSASGGATREGLARRGKRARIRARDTSFRSWPPARWEMATRGRREENTADESAADWRKIFSIFLNTNARLSRVATMCDVFHHLASSSSTCSGPNIQTRGFRAWLCVIMCDVFHHLASSSSACSGPASPHIADNNIAYPNEATR